MTTVLSAQVVKKVGQVVDSKTSNVALRHSDRDFDWDFDWDSDWDFNWDSDWDSDPDSDRDSY